MRLVSAAVGSAVLAAAPALAACPVELATYGEAQSGARLEFVPAEGAAVTNAFRLLMGDSLVLDGVVMWTEDVPRPRGMLMYKCPEGDVTGSELAGCIVWEGVVYAADDAGHVGLLPGKGDPAPRALVLSDLGPSLRNSAVYAAEKLSSVPSDVFVQNGCQE
ncbi:MAG: hypothetical protein J0H34_13125 [Rhizobiales bacterium]|nr:hypothetical protein [Hyphomicrobiales bacterium]